MFIWFSMLAVLGIVHLSDDLSIFRAINPYYAVEFLTNYPHALWLLGAVFLCTTGAEALYSDLGHCGRGNIRVSWIFVKTCLLLNYLGQGAYLLNNHSGKIITNALREQQGINAFYDLMPQWFIIPGVIIATAAAIIASQAMISGSFTLISEAMRLNLWPKLKIRYPSEERGQLCRLCGCGIILSKFSKNGSCLRPRNHHDDVDDDHPVLKFYGSETNTPRVYMDFSCFVLFS
jgi:KUP system potassium uptake protein